jgi:hemoglobin
LRGRKDLSDRGGDPLVNANFDPKLVQVERNRFFSRHATTPGPPVMALLPMQNPRDIYTPNVNPGSIPGPSREIYAKMGGDNVYRMLEDFYGELGRSEIRELFPPDLVEASKRSAAFFVQLLGGPPEYNERFGNPRMRARHLPFRITTEARDEWLRCFERVLVDAPAKYAFPEEHLEGFKGFLRGFSMWMVNTKE